MISHQIALHSVQLPLLIAQILLIDEHLRWKEQIDSISIIKSYWNYSTSKKICFTRYLELMYHSLVLPYFDYSSLVWNNCSQTLKDKVQRLQNSAARVITGDNYDIRSSDIFNKLGWNNLQDRRNSQTMNYVTKALLKKCPEGINEMFHVISNDNQRRRNIDNCGWGGGQIFIYSCSQTVKTIDFKRN